MSVLSEEDQPIVGQYYQVQDRYTHDKIYNSKFVAFGKDTYYFDHEIKIAESREPGFNGCHTLVARLVTQPVFIKSKFSGMFRVLFFNVAPEFTQ